MPDNRFLDDLAFRFIEHDRFLNHLPEAPICQQWLRDLISFMPLGPTSFVPGQPSAIACPRQEIGERVVSHDVEEIEMSDAGNFGTASIEAVCLEAERRKPSGSSIAGREWHPYRRACALPLLSAAPITQIIMLSFSRKLT